MSRLFSFNDHKYVDVALGILFGIALTVVIHLSSKQIQCVKSIYSCILTIQDFSKIKKSLTNNNV